VKGSRNSKSTVFEDSLDAARKEAFKILSRRDRSACEVAQKLSKKGFSEEIVSAAILSLKNGRYLDDLRFARSWIRYRLESQHFGPIRLKKELREKGILPGEIDKVLREVGEECDLYFVVESALRSRYKDLSALQDPSLRRRAFDFLRRKGHSPEVIFKLFKKLDIPSR